jgi:hypothetical protein
VFLGWFGVTNAKKIQRQNFSSRKNIDDTKCKIFTTLPEIFFVKYVGL